MVPLLPPAGESASTFGERKKARQSEIEGLNQAAEVLKNAFKEVGALKGRHTAS